AVPGDQFERAFALADRAEGLGRRAPAASAAGARAPARGRHQRERSHDGTRHRQSPHDARASSWSKDPSVAPEGASTGRLLLLRQTNRTALPRTCRASIELVLRFCCITTSVPPASSSTMYRVVAPRYTTSRTCPVAAQTSGSTGSSNSCIEIFS